MARDGGVGFILSSASPLLAALICLLLPVPAAGRTLWGRTLGPNCTVRVDKGECVTNPLFMEKDCKSECSHLAYFDTNTHYCKRHLRLCLDRSSTFEQFVFTQCNHTCRHHYRAIESILAPGNLQMLMHALLPVVYTVALVALLAYQGLVSWSNVLMLKLEKMKASYPRLSERGQSWLIVLCDNQDSLGGFGPQAIGRLFVCGYYVVEGGLIIGIMAVLVYIGPKIRLHRTHPTMLRNSIIFLFVYTLLQAMLTLLKDYLTHHFAAKLTALQSGEAHHQPVYVEGPVL